MATTTNKKASRSEKFDSYIGPTDPKIDHDAVERLVTARIGLLLKHPFFGNLATRLRLVNADDWLPTGATDGYNLYYNSRFVMSLRTKEVEFLLAHEIMHLCYDSLGRRGNRDPKLWNIASDYTINADLKKHKIGEFITTIQILYDKKYEGWTSERVYDHLMQNVKKVSIDELADMLLDDHLDTDNGDGDNESSDNEGKPGSGRPKMTEEEREKARNEIKQAIISAYQHSEAGDVPAGLSRAIRDLIEPKMPWRELIQTNLTSIVKNDYTWQKAARRGWHMDAILPGSLPGEEIDVTIALDMSGSISDKEAQTFLSEIAGMMDMFDGYKITVFSFDTKVYNEQVFTSENLENIGSYVPKGGGGTSFNCIYEHLIETENVPKRLIIFTDLYCNEWGLPEYCDTTWIGFGPGAKSIVPPHGTVAYYDD